MIFVLYDNPVTTLDAFVWIQLFHEEMHVDVTSYFDTHK